jgi:hypothetical protein
MYKGNYKSTDQNGNRSIYLIGEKVFFQGQIYEAISNTSFSPTQSPSAWKITGTFRPFISESAPLNPIVGQQWIKGGVIYTYYQDADGYSWVEV